MALSLTLNQNEFFGNLVNLVVKTRVNRTVKGERINELIDSCLIEGTPYGDGSLHITVDTLNVGDYSETSSILTNVKPTVDEQVISTTDRKKIQVTLNRWVSRGAFADEYSLDEMLGAVEEMLNKTKFIYLYKKIVSAYDGWVPTQATQTVTVDLIDTTGMTGATKIESEKANALAIYTVIKRVSLAMQAPSRKYNDLEFEEMYNADDIDFISNGKFESLVNTYAIASLLHSDKLDNIKLYDKSIIIPEEQFTTDAIKQLCIGWLVSKNKYVISPRFEVMTSFEDGSNLMIQDFLHFWLNSGFVNGLAGVKLVANFVAPEA